MATVPTYPVGEDPATTGLNALSTNLANAVLGKNTDTQSSSTQNTDNTSTQNTGVTGNTATSQNTNTSGSQNTNMSGSNSQQQTGATSQLVSGATGTVGNTTQNSTQSNTSLGDSSTTGSQRTTGSIGTSGSQTTSGKQTTSQNADVSGLQAVLARQLGGATPEMMRAIFEEGAKAAPNLVVAQAGALGARGVGNSPMAQVLNQLNADLTNKAAMLNVQMLSDASGTAGRIADLTKSTTTASDQTTQTVQDQVQDLLTSTNSQQLSKQVADVVNSTVGSMNQQQTNTQQQTGTSTLNQTGTQQQSTAQSTLQNQMQTGSTDMSQNQVQTGTQNQTATLNKDEKVRQQQVLNSNLLGKAAGLLAGGLGISAAFNAAKQSGFLGTAVDFVKGLFKNGTPYNVIDRALRESNLPGITITADGALDTAALEAYVNTLPNPADLLPNIDLGTSGESPDVGSIWDDISGIVGFADGGKLEFLPTPVLAEPKKPVVEQDTSIQTMMEALGIGGAAGSYLSSDSGSSSGSGSPTTGISDSGSGENGGPSSSASNSGGSAATGGNPAGLGPAADAAAQSPANAIGNAALGTAVGTIGAMMGVPGPVAGLLGKAIANEVAPVSHAPAISPAVAALAQMAQEQFTIAEHTEANNEGHAASANAAANAAAAAADAAANIGIDAADAGFGSGAAGDSGGDSAGNGVGGVGDGVGGPWADGGQPSRLIQGPGTGISDSIPAKGPNGEPIRVSHGEYIVPADVVAKFGADAFDQLLAQHHVPASMQKAIFGE